MDVLLVHNESAGDEVGSAHELQAMLRQAGYRSEMASAKDDWTKRLQNRPDLIVAAGGDGTARRVALAASEHRIPFAILAYGTANNVARSLLQTGEARALIDAWERTPARLIDLGRMRTGDQEHTFLEAAGGGLFGDMVRRGAELIDKAHYVGRETERMLQLLVAMAGDSSLAPWDVRIDGIDHSGNYAAVEVMNIRFAGPNIPLAPSADSGDGLLDVALIDEVGRRELVRYAQERVALEAASVPAVELVRGRSIELRSPARVAFHVDDDVVTLTQAETVTIEVIPGAGRVVAPGYDRPESRLFDVNHQR